MTDRAKMTFKNYRHMKMEQTQPPFIIVSAKPSLLVVTAIAAAALPRTQGDTTSLPIEL